MSIVYVNNFNHLVYSLLPPAQVSASLAAFDTPVLIPGHAPSFLGPMYAGASAPKPDAAIEISVETIGEPPLQFNIIEGTSATLFNAAADESRTFYVVGPNAIVLSRGNRFTADLVFDKPQATLDPGLSGKVWAVGLNFKTGDATDLPTDMRAGVTCQFNDHGFIKFHGVANAWDGPITDTYASFNGDPLTEFRLSVSIIVQGNTISGTGALQYGQNASHTGPLVFVGDAPAAHEVTAVGLALATTKGGFEDFGVRLRSFTLSVARGRAQSNRSVRSSEGGGTPDRRSDRQPEQSCVIVTGRPATAGFRQSLRRTPCFFTR